jgi:hypothetical protein
VSLFKLLRIVVLLSILFVVVVGNWLTDRRLASWERPVWVTVYPIMGDDSAATQAFVEKADQSYYADINSFLETQAGNYSIGLTPVMHVQIAAPSAKRPPEVPDQYSPVAVALWSLRMRYWAWRMDRTDGWPSSDIQMFVLYHDSSERQELDMSVAMRKGRFGLVNAFASDEFNSRNQVVMAHELLHVFGATDKYIMGSGEPEYPFGYADPNQVPLYPQTRAEITGGRIPLTSFSSEMPPSLDYCKIGQKTAEEIGFFAQLQK